MKNRSPKINDRKLRGEWAEMYFMACAAGHGLPVNRPYGEMSHFDFIIGDHGCLLRVQVKSTMRRAYNGYSCTVRGGHRPYVADVFDFLAALIVPEQVWYIVPAELVVGRATITLYPSSETCKYAAYKEAWHLLRPRACALRGTVPRIEACAQGALNPVTSPLTPKAGLNGSPGLPTNSVIPTREDYREAIIGGVEGPAC